MLCPLFGLDANSNCLCQPSVEADGSMSIQGCSWIERLDDKKNGRQFQDVCSREIRDV